MATSLPAYDLSVDEVRIGLSYYRNDPVEPFVPKQEAEEEEAPVKQQQQQQQQQGGGKKQKGKQQQQQQNNNKGQGKQKQQQKKKEEPPQDRPLTEEEQGYYDRVRSVGEECIAEEELKKLIQNKKGDKPIVFYDGFEPSGRMHIAQGIFKAMNVNKCVSGNNCKFVFWVADWFALMNDKMGGDLEKIQIVGEYLQQVWKAAGMNLAHVEFLWASKEITQRATLYWPIMLNIASKFNITRIKKCCQIMGRLEGKLTAAQILYPLMQCTDVFFLATDICQLGVDQRKVNMLAREYMDSINKKKSRFQRKPIILSHHMLFGLKAGQEKMSKSDPDSAIFMEDAASDVERKILNAYCPSKEEEVAAQAGAEGGGGESMHLIEDKLKNPCLDYVQYIIFSPPNATFKVEGLKEYTDFESVKTDFLNGQMTEEQLKQGLISALNLLLEPVRNHFENDATAKHLLEQVQQFKKETSNVPVKNTAAIRRLNLVQLEKIPANSHLVFMPLPNTNPSLQETISLLFQLRSAVTAANGNTVVLYLSDWSARVCNACGGSGTGDGLDEKNEEFLKGIEAYYSIVLSALKILDSATFSKIQVLRQSEAILLDPSNYWISVINVGRHFMLNDVMSDSVKDSDNVGIIIARLMMVADVMGIEPVSISVLEGGVEQSLVERFFNEKLVTDDSNMKTPAFHVVTAPNVKLQEEKQTEAEKTENDEYFLLDDSKQHGKSKLKKAFCKPGEIAFCPPISLACVFTFDLGDNSGSSSIVIKRSEENGGDATYKSQAELSADFESGSLHPGDLKASTTTIMVQILEQLNASMKKEPETTKSIKFLKAYQKKLSKNKKKK